MIRSLSRILLFTFVALAVSSARAAARNDFAGTWVMRLGDRTLFVLKLAIVDGSGGSAIQGILERPSSFNENDTHFTEISNTPRKDTITASHFADGLLHFTTQNANDAKDQDSFTMTLLGNSAKLSLDGLPAGVVWEPLVFERTLTPAAISTNWNPERAYIIGDSDIPNAEMKTIFDEDQRVRTTTKIDWAAVNKSDAKRRDRTHQLLADGALHTAKDFEEASFVFQHGDKPEDYLLAHTLAMVAVAKGSPTAIWIAAATLDRYLQNGDQKQIYGTQYRTGSDHKWTQDPYNRDLIPDTLRRQLAVPPQAAQAKQLETYQNEK